MKISKRSSIIVIICFLVLAGTFVWTKASKNGGGKFPGGGPGGKGGMEGGSEIENVVSVKTQLAEITTLQDYVNTNGEIESQTSIDVFPDRGGKIVSVNIHLGSYVKKGDVLAEIDPSEPGAQYAHSPIIAPISGTITTTPLKNGTTVSASSVFTTIGDVENLQVTANIPERYVSTLKIGLKANVVLESYPDEVFKASIVRVSPVVDSKSRTKEIILNFDKNNPKINAGMFAKVTLFTVEYSGAVTVTEDALIEKDDSHYVFVVSPDGKSVNLREVQVGNSVDGIVQITSGVAQGEYIVVEGMRSLAEGSLIHDISEKEALND
ncbi:MAG: efflux RND transporter periplasmic adaptor subunit [Spirochaetales bacterium]|nr:efflux RND transporter periplasmic adaptor subunit [Spirochaetia bacterium]MDD7013365.1 efflux RND transporter periplasmic adaptor subunit [Spirochaetales bacterium]